MAETAMSLANNDQEVIDLLVERMAARNAGNFARADEIRKQLTEAGVRLEDDHYGTLFYRGNNRWPIRVGNQ
jgi:cysteinyl-tRNA synthetase